MNILKKQPAKKCSKLTLQLIVVLLIVTGTTPSRLQAQHKTVYKIAAYEYNCRGQLNMEHPRYKYEIRNLFRRQDTGWVINNTNTSAVYSRVYKGLVLNKIKGSYAVNNGTGDSEAFIDSSILFPVNPVLLKTMYFSKPFKNNDPGIVKKVALLSTNPTYRQHVKLSFYVPGPQEKKRLLDTTKIYLGQLFRNNSACIEMFHSFIDTIIRYAVAEKDSIVIDSANSFVDGAGNKLITVLFPARTQWSFAYPFDRKCNREDNAFEYYRILCYLQNDGRLFFLRDELFYLDHGDFDNDGKDEFLFWTSRFNHDGYVLYYDDFRKVVSYLWSYH